MFIWKQMPARHIFAAALVSQAFMAGPAIAQKTDWLITQKTSGQSYNTQTRQFSTRGISMEGLLSVRQANDQTLKLYWSKGAKKLTIELNGQMVVDGHDIEDQTRISSARLSQTGALIYVRTTRGRGQPVELVKNGSVIHSWKPGSYIRLLAYDEKGLLFSSTNRKTGGTAFMRFAYDASTGLDTSKAIEAGNVDTCIVLSARNHGDNLLLEAICNDEATSKLYELAPDSTLSPWVERIADVSYAQGLFAKHGKDRKRGEVGVLTVSGSPDALHLYYATSAALLSNLGEPASLSSDEAGRQSWTQSYRTSALATLYEKTDHPVFAALATQAMANTLAARNAAMSIGGSNNPSCGWASRVYSTDGVTPLSFSVNQAMIVQGLLRSCAALGDACPITIKAEIDRSAICLAEHYEQDFDQASHLYQIPKDIPFRNDGIWAPWNWQTNWANVLGHAGSVAKKPEWTTRAEGIFEAFSASIKNTPEGGLMRYWPPQYYQGWSTEDDVSTNRARFKPASNERYEDISHGGISLMAACEFGLKGSWRQSAQRRLHTILEQGLNVARDMDGRGAVSPRWLPAVGWDCLNSKPMRNLYTRRLSGGKGGPRMFTYARLYRPQAPFELKLSLERCSNKTCAPVKNWTFKSARDYLTGSPFFDITPLP